MKKFNQKYSQQRGAIAIEMIFVLIPMLLIILLSFDLTRYIQSKDQLDRLGYSLATIISLRSQYYIDSNDDTRLPLAQEQVDQLATIARSELGHSDVTLNVHQVALSAGANYRGNQTEFQDISIGDLSLKCPPFNSAPFKDQLKADASDTDAAITLFVVELCVELSDYSLFAKLSNSSDFSAIYSRHITVAR